MKTLAKIAVAVFAIGVIGSWVAGSILMAPSRSEVAKPPGLVAEDVAFASPSGDKLYGWWMPGKPASPSIVFVHGINANRLAMLDRAGFFSKRGYSVLLFDLPAHGQSSGTYISFGVRESSAVSASLGWVRAKKKAGKVGVDGLSLGGASALLRAEHVGFDAIVIEAVFPNIHRAILNRLTDRFGILGYVLDPLLEIQLVIRLHEWPSDLAPIDQISKVGAPILVIGGEKDHLTPADETQELFLRAREPKTLWIVPGAGHADFLKARRSDFESIVGGFFYKYLEN